MQLCCEDVISTLRKYVTVSTNTTLGSCARKMRYEDAPPQSSCARKMRICFHDGMSTFSEKRGHTVGLLCTYIATPLAMVHSTYP
ncbi:hypothetical protein JYU34_003033 [Plutella xylostella]|uniref:Uncharacterized protein n=1 Tax=Plutella xylostella TaxID=51655 RepID=A0ABQ7QYZ8_PLUXY|nr:hypothetical protein JYU34_003033 [Plutella xylostella]